MSPKDPSVSLSYGFLSIIAGYMWIIGIYCACTGYQCWLLNLNLQTVWGPHDFKLASPWLVVLHHHKKHVVPTWPLNFFQIDRLIITDITRFPNSPEEYRIFIYHWYLFCVLFGNLGSSSVSRSGPKARLMAASPLNRSTFIKSWASFGVMDLNQETNPKWNLLVALEHVNPA